MECRELQQEFLQVMQGCFVDWSWQNSLASTSLQLVASSSLHIIKFTAAHKSVLIILFSSFVKCMNSSPGGQPLPKHPDKRLYISSYSHSNRCFAVHKYVFSEQIFSSTCRPPPSPAAKIRLLTLKIWEHNYLLS